ncbi:MAG: hypothetical protein LQ350_008597, partial [Teloschistes chrysophthalmus]
MDCSIREWHGTCRNAFNVLLETPPINDEYSKQFSHDSLVDLIGRFNVWAGNIGAGQAGKASLDYRLQEASYIKAAIVQSLQYLAEAIQEAHSIIGGHRRPYEELSSDSDSTLSSDSDDTRPNDGIGSEVNAEVARENFPSMELQQLQNSMASFIRNLYQASVIIRKRPVPHDRLVKSAKIDTSFYECFDERHVQENYPHTSPELSKRLGIANSRRRKFFKYREQHREKLSLPPRDETLSVAEANNAHALIETPSSALIDRPEDAHGTKHGTRSLKPPSTIRESNTASTFIAPPIQRPLDLEAADQNSDAPKQTIYESVTS